MYNTTAALSIATLGTVIALVMTNSHDAVYLGMIAIFMTGAAICHSIRNMNLTVMLIPEEQLEEAQAEQEEADDE